MEIIRYKKPYTLLPVIKSRRSVRWEPSLALSARESSAPKSASVTPDSIQTYFSIEGSLGSIYPWANRVRIGRNRRGRYRHHHQPEWRVPIEIRTLYPKVRFSHIGYLPQRDRWSELINKHTVLSLEPKVISIQEVIVRLTNPKRLLQEMLDERRSNYSQHPIYLTTFYREGVGNVKRTRGLTRLF